MAAVEVSQTDVARIKVILACLARGKFELEGNEVLAFAQAIHWASAFQEQIVKAISSHPPVAASPAVESAPKVESINKNKKGKADAK